MRRGVVEGILVAAAAGLEASDVRISEAVRVLGALGIEVERSRATGAGQAGQPLGQSRVARRRRRPTRTGGSAPHLLRRIEHERVADLPGITRIFWWGGKGVTGKCCLVGKEQIHDAGAFEEKHGDYTRQQWRTLDRDTRMGLSYRNWQRIKGKYGTVVAVPMFHGRRVLGCVVLDAPPGLHQELLEADDVVEAVAAAATLISGQLA